MRKLFLSIVVSSLVLLQLPAFADTPQSDEAQANNNYFCKGGFLTDENTSEPERALFKDNQAKLKKFCHFGTFYCTNNTTLFSRNKGVCDTDNLCKEDYLKAACKVACVDRRPADAETLLITNKLNACYATPPEAPKAPVTPPVMFDEVPGLQSQGLAESATIVAVEVPQIDSETVIAPEPLEVPAMAAPVITELSTDAALPQLNAELNQEGAIVDGTLLEGDLAANQLAIDLSQLAPQTDDLSNQGPVADSEMTAPLITDNILSEDDLAANQLAIDLSQPAPQTDDLSNQGPVADSEMTTPLITDNILSEDDLAANQLAIDLSQPAPQTDNLSNQDPIVDSEMTAPTLDDALSWNE